MRPVPVFRPTARILVVDAAGRLVMFGGQISADAARTWLTPGGGVRSGESLEQAAVRELAEETGLALTPERLGPVVACSSGLWRAGSQVFRSFEARPR